MKVKLLIVFFLLILGAIWVNSQFNSNYACVPITFSQSNVPVIDTKINNTNYPLKLDIGSNAMLSLDKSILASISKQNYGSTHWMDMKGNHYDSPRYLISELMIGNIAFNEILVEEQNDKFVQEARIVKDPTMKPSLGAIGRPLLKRTNLFLDFPHSRIILTDDIKTIQKAGCSIEKMLAVPFHKTLPGIVISICTDLGEKNFLLDTGSSLTLIKSSLLSNQALDQNEDGLLMLTTKEFKIENKDYGSTTLYSFVISNELSEIDGILGMDFLQNHSIYIDYPHNTIYIN